MYFCFFSKCHDICFLVQTNIFMTLSIHLAMFGVTCFLGHVLNARPHRGTAQIFMNWKPEIPRTHQPQSSPANCLWNPWWFNLHTNAGFFTRACGIAMVLKSWDSSCCLRVTYVHLCWPVILWGLTFHQRFLNPSSSKFTCQVTHKCGIPKVDFPKHVPLFSGTCFLSKLRVSPKWPNRSCDMLWPAAEV